MTLKNKRVRTKTGNLTMDNYETEPDILLCKRDIFLHNINKVIMSKNKQSLDIEHNDNTVTTIFFCNNSNYIQE